MKIDQYGQVELTEAEALEAVYSQGLDKFFELYINDTKIVEQFNLSKAVNADKIITVATLPVHSLSIEKWDKINQSQWFMPEKYKNFDLINWLFDQCHSEQQTNRVATELELFIQFDMIELLKYLKYLVDIMREHNVLWGVGRGSSVASYVLFLIGIHKIDSLAFDLDIKEFLK